MQKAVDAVVVHAALKGKRRQIVLALQAVQLFIEHATKPSTVPRLGVSRVSTCAAQRSGRRGPNFLLWVKFAWISTGVETCSSEGPQVQVFAA